MKTRPWLLALLCLPPLAYGQDQDRAPDAVNDSPAARASTPSVPNTSATSPAGAAAKSATDVNAPGSQSRSNPLINGPVSGSPDKAGTPPPGVGANLSSQATSVDPNAKPDAAQKTLTLEDCVTTAIHASTSVLKAQRDDEVGSTQVLQSYLQFLPNLTTQAGYNSSRGKTFLTSTTPTLVDGSSYGANISISTTLNLFNGFSDVAAWRAAHDRRSSFEKNLFRAKQQISLDIAQSFLQSVLDQKLVVIAEKNLKASQDRQTLLEEQTKVGLRNKSDLFRQQAQTSSDEAFLINSRNKAQTDFILLLRKLRVDPREEYILAEPASFKSETDHMDAAPAPLESQAIEKALSSRVDYDSTRLNAEAAHSDVTSLRSTYWPKLDLVATYLTSGRNFDSQTVAGNDVLTAGNNFGTLDDQLRNQGSSVYGIVLTWNLFDRWSSSLNVERAKATAFKADLDAEDYRRQVIGEVRQAIGDFKSAAQQLETSERGLIAAQKAYEVSEGRYEVGSITYVDLATAQTALVQAQANRAQALIGYELQKRAIDYAIGITATD